MRDLLLLGIFITFSLILQIFFLRVSKDLFALTDDDLRIKKMIRMIYVNLGVYIVLIVLLFGEMCKHR